MQWGPGSALTHVPSWSTGLSKSIRVLCGFDSSWPTLQFPGPAEPLVLLCRSAPLLKLLCANLLQSCPTLCNSMNRSTPGLPVHHQLPEFTQTHVHRVGDAIQPSHPLSSPSPPAPSPSQHQGLFQWVSSSNKVAKVLEFQLQHQSFQWTLRTDLLQDGLIGSPCGPRDSQESSIIPQFKSSENTYKWGNYEPRTTAERFLWLIGASTSLWLPYLRFDLFWIDYWWFFSVDVEAAFFF